MTGPAGCCTTTAPAPAEARNFASAPSHSQHPQALAQRIGDRTGAGHHRYLQACRQGHPRPGIDNVRVTLAPHLNKLLAIP